VRKKISLRFLADPEGPFDNNQADRDIRWLPFLKFNSGDTLYGGCPFFIAILNLSCSFAAHVNYSGQSHIIRE
jgi:hypothetical protein